MKTLLINQETIPFDLIASAETFSLDNRHEFKENIEFARNILD